MNRTHRWSHTPLEQNIQLIRKLAWSFHQTTGYDYDDLFQEAALAYCLCLKQWNPDRGKLSTFMWRSITGHLTNYLAKQKKQPLAEVPLKKVNKTVEMDSLFEMLSNGAMEVARVVLSSPRPFVTRPENAGKRIISLMSRRGWSKYRSKAVIKELQIAFK